MRSASRAGPDSLTRVAPRSDNWPVTDAPARQTAPSGPEPVAVRPSWRLSQAPAWPLTVRFSALSADIVAAASCACRSTRLPAMVLPDRQTAPADRRRWGGGSSPAHGAPSAAGPASLGAAGSAGPASAQQHGARPAAARRPEVPARGGVAGQDEVPADGETVRDQRGTTAVDQPGTAHHEVSADLGAG